MNRTIIEQVMSLLATAYGKPKQRPRMDPLSELVQTILSQNTSDANSRPAFRNLLATFGNLDAVAAASTDDIASVIKSGGMNRIKARYIKDTLGKIKRQRGKLDLSFLNQLPTTEARKWLTSLPGVGMKTANCVLLFSLRKPALPVDTHVLRVAKRLGMVDSRASAEKATVQLEGVVPPAEIYEFHMLLITHGRRTCKAQRPLCAKCVLAAICPSYEVFVGRRYGEEIKS
ncbi:MAG: endonuclease III [Chloroflexi bacterium]|nr:endonuclease III [Chloroflexota bacterium]